MIFIKKICKLLLQNTIQVFRWFEIITLECGSPELNLLFSGIFKIYDILGKLSLSPLYQQHADIRDAFVLLPVFISPTAKTQTSNSLLSRFLL